MNRRQMIQSLALTALGTSSFLSGTSRAAAENSPVAIKVLGPMRVSESLVFNSQLKVTFLSVIDDSRCPLDKKCKDPGDFEVVLRIRVGKKKPKNYYLHSQQNPRQLTIPAGMAATGTTGIPKSYIVDIATLNPPRYTGKKILQADYELRLHIGVVL